MCSAVGRTRRGGAKTARRRPHHLDHGHRRCGAVAGRPHRREAGPAPRRAAGAAFRPGLRRRRGGGGPTARLSARRTRRRRGPGVGRALLAHAEAPYRYRHPGRGLSVRRRSRGGRGGRGTPRRTDRRQRTRHPGSRSHLYPDSLRTMGWDIGASGFQIVLGPEVPTLIERYLGDDVTSSSLTHDLTIDEVGAWVSHPGGPKVIEAITATLGLPDDALELTWRSLSEVGNISSASVLHVLRDTMAKHPPSGSPGVLMAMGPGSVPKSCCCAGTDLMVDSCTRTGVPGTAGLCRCRRKGFCGLPIADGPAHLPCRARAPRRRR